jgi:hypothetical protein
MDIWQLPAPLEPVPEMQPKPRRLTQPAGLQHAELDAQRKGTSDLRPGVSAGARGDLPPVSARYELPHPKLPEPQVITPGQKPVLPMPSAQE